VQRCCPCMFGHVVLTQAGVSPKQRFEAGALGWGGGCSDPEPPQPTCGGSAGTVPWRTGICFAPGSPPDFLLALRPRHLTPTPNPPGPCAWGALPGAGGCGPPLPGAGGQGLDAGPAAAGTYGCHTAGEAQAPGAAATRAPAPRVPEGVGGSGGC